MLRKLFLLIVFFCVSSVSFANSIYTKEQIDQLSKTQSRVAFNGDAIMGITNGYRPHLKIDASQQQYYSDNAVVSFVQLSQLRNYYDLQSNASATQIWQDPNNLNNIHAIYMLSTDAGTTWPDRTTQYFYSTDKGVTWAFISNVPATGRSGYGMITGLSTGSAMIALHTGSGNVRSQFFVDAFSGLGSFTNLDPGSTQDAKYSWPKVVLTQSGSVTNKFFFIASTSTEDSSFTNIGLSFTNSSFTGYKQARTDQAETYSIARSSDGKIGVAYVPDDIRFPNDQGDVFFIESTDNGTTFSSPLRIFDSDFSSDSLGSLRGINIVYQGTTAKVVFETIKQRGTFYFPGVPNNIRFWSPSLPGADPNRSIIIADSNNIPFAPYQGTRDVEAFVCRPSIGVSSDGADLFVGFMVQNPETSGADSSSYNDIYLTVSGNNGASWKKPFIITPASPRYDWAYVSVSKVNDKLGNTDYINMTMQRDSVPGANVNVADPGTNAYQFFVRVSYPSPIGINPVNTIAEDYSLMQNYPNPFNPVTNIRFSLPKISNVTLKVYSAEGKEVAVLVNNEIVNAGTKEVSFNASNLASGVYFYTITAGDFRETKKMLLLK
ncbi:MAG: T9SS type A sorting domain-containing protein [Bacteroidetes bacterium]|nr:T9SS type A sorting domain-containing protein [Bacteroidota bacterium]